MDIRKIKNLIELFKKSNISEIEIHEGKNSVRIKQHISTIDKSTQHLINTETIPLTNATSLAPDTYHSDKFKNVASSSNYIVRTPIVGTFYRSPAPTEKPFVKVGDTVNLGDILCIVEAMKILNQIEAECAGTITEILLENGQPVEFGQPLFVIIKKI